MAVPFRRTSKSRKKLRRSHHGLKTLRSCYQTSLCKNCFSVYKNHNICLKCNFYNGKNLSKIKKTDEKIVNNKVNDSEINDKKETN